MTTLLCINGKSRNGAVDLGAVEEKLRALGPILKCRLHAGDDPKQMLADHRRWVSRIVVGGGDGTLNRLLPTLVDAGLPCGVLPMGTANDFARSLNLSLEPVAAVDTILAGTTRRVELGEVNGILFVNAVGIGLGPELTRKLDGERKQRLGVLAYFSSLLQTVHHRRFQRATLTIDSERIRSSFIQITIANGIHYGGGLTIAENADFADGCLRVLCLKPQTIFGLLRNFPLLRWGNTGNHDSRAALYRGHDVNVVTRRAQDVTADGELVTKTPIRCRTAQAELTVFAPAAE